MKSMWQSVQVLNVSKRGNKTVMQIATDASLEEIERYRNNNKITGVILLDDKHRITAEQRRKIFATLKDISLYTGYEAEYLRDLLTLAYCIESNIEQFSLSDCSLEMARNFISYLIEFCLDNEIPLAESALNRTDDINKYLYLCIRKSICCLCGSQGVNYSVGNKKICLCEKHHDIAKFKGLKEFERLFKVYAIKVKERDIL